MAMQDRRQSAIVEKYMVTVMSTVTCAVLVWCGNSIIELKTEVAKLGEKFVVRAEMAAQQAEISVIRAEVQRIANEQASMASFLPQMRRN